MTCKHLFVSAEGRMRPRWTEAFPDARSSTRLQDGLAADLLWLLLTQNGDDVAQVAAARRAVPDRRLIVLSDVVEDAQGLRVLGAGAAGYVNGHATAEVLQQVMATVLSGGFWIGQSLMQHLMTRVTGRLDSMQVPSSGDVAADWEKLLTEREIKVAKTLSLGATNKEIAQQLGISERTVKAHLGSVFEKLRVRDRLQLTLLVRNNQQAA